MRLIFSLNPGRCGTHWLAKAFATVPGVHSEHEDPPTFVEVMNAVQGRPDEARRWLTNVALSYIRSLDCAVYSKMSHLFVQGFVEPMLSLGVVPDVVVIHRPAREVALSMWRLGETPGRTGLGLRYRLSPDDPGMLLSVEDYSAWSDYKLCLWHYWEVQLRIQKYTPMLTKAGARVVEIQTNELSSRFLDLVKFLGLPDPDMSKFDAMRYDHLAGTRAEQRAIWPSCDMDADEQEIQSMVDEYAALL